MNGCVRKSTNEPGGGNFECTKIYHCKKGCSSFFNGKLILVNQLLFHLAGITFSGNIQLDLCGRPEIFTNTTRLEREEG